MEFPRYMEKGSRGPAVNLILAFLIGWGRGDIKDVVPDADYGEKGAGHMKRFQTSHGLDADGGCGPETRSFLLNRYGFDFEAAAQATGGTTVFVQDDGTEISWSPEPDDGLETDDVAIEHVGGTD
jgi:hypothetical protein